MAYPEMTPERFWAKVNKNGPIVRPELGPCWLWPRVGNNGYGKTTIRLKHWAAHRLAWVYANGEIPEGLCVCHSCDTPTCVRPTHLWLGTSQENTTDKVLKNRGATRTKIVNESFVKNSNMKLCEWDVRLIRAFSKEFTNAKIAPIFGISRAYVSEVVSGKTWGHIPCL